MRRTGFTLVELLMVIAIIAVLAGLLIPLIGYAKTAAKNSKCEAQLGNIKAAFAVFKDANGFYPEKYLTNPTDPSSDVYASVFKPGGAFATADAVGSSGWKTIAEKLLEQLQTVDRDNFRDLKSLRDPFTTGAMETNVFRYRPAKFYPLNAASAGLLQIDSENPPNPDSYQLWSAGADGKDQFGERVDGRKSDDIANWKTP